MTDDEKLAKLAHEFVQKYVALWLYTRMPFPATAATIRTEARARHA